MTHRVAVLFRVHEATVGVAGLTIVVAIGNHQSRDAKTRGIPRLRKETGDTPVLSFSLGFPGTIGNTRLLLGGHTAYPARETTLTRLLLARL